MGLITRPAKASSGSTAYADGTTPVAAEFNADHDTAYNEINGNLEDVNLKVAANLDPTKVGDASADATAMGVVASVGALDAESLATTLTGELQRLRFTIGRIGIGSTGSNVKRNDGAAKSVPWYDRPARAGNYIRNGSFEAQSGGPGTAPNGWTMVATPTTLSLVATDLTNGIGKALRIVSDAANEGVSQTLAGLPASAQLLLTARVKVAAGSMRMVTTGAAPAGEYRNVDITETSVTAVQLNAIIATDGLSPVTPIVVQFLSAAPGDDFQVDNVRLHRIGAEVLGLPSGVALQHRSTDTNALANVLQDTPNPAYLNRAVTVPCPGCTIRVTAQLSFTSTVNSASAYAQILENDGGGDTAVAGPTACRIDNNRGGSISLSYVKENPTPGLTYLYRTQAASTNVNVSINGTEDPGGGVLTLASQLTVELIPPQ